MFSVVTVPLVTTLVVPCLDKAWILAPKFQFPGIRISRFLATSSPRELTGLSKETLDCPSSKTALKSKPYESESSTETCRTLTLIATWRDNLAFCSLIYFATFLMSFGVAVSEIVPLAESIVSFESLSTMDVMAFSILPHNSTSTVLESEIDELPFDPSVWPPT